MRFSLLIIAVCAALGLAACGGDDETTTTSSTTPPTTTGATGPTGADASSGAAGAVEKAIEDSRGGLDVTCSDDVSLDEGAEFDCDYEETDLETSGTMTVAVESVSGSTATINYDGKASSSDGVETTAEGSGIEVKVP